MEISAGGLVIDGIDGPREAQLAALIGRMDRRDRMLWSLPRATSSRRNRGSNRNSRSRRRDRHTRRCTGPRWGIDYWFVTDGRRVPQDGSSLLMRFAGGELCDEDVG